MSLFVRPSTPEDFQAVFKLLMELWPDKVLAESAIEQSFKTGLASDSDIYLTAVLDDHIVGFASISLVHSLYHGGQMACVEALVSDKNSRGKGIGSTLMSRVMEEGLSRDCRAIEIMIDHQAHAVKFVKSKGFELRGNAFELKLL